MSEGVSLCTTRIAILGLGLMGGSLAMALRGKCARLVGLDRDPQACAEAVDRGIVELAGLKPSEILPGSDLVILALPVNAILEFIKDIPTYHPGNAVIIDLGSTKTKIVESMEVLPERFDPVGGHPMCGKEKSSLAFADPDIYHDAPFAFTSLSRTSTAARSLAEQLATTIGSHPLWINAQTHDRWVAATSHLPYLIASALAASLSLDVTPLIGPGYRSASRLAGSSPEMMIDILKTNRENILAAIEGFQNQLGQVEILLTQSKYPLLLEFLNGTLHHQAALLDSHEQGKLLKPGGQGGKPCN